MHSTPDRSVCCAFGRVDEACYTLTQHLGDSTSLGTSDEACVTVPGCSTTRSAPSAALMLGAVALTRRRRVG